MEAKRKRRAVHGTYRRRELKESNRNGYKTGIMKQTVLCALLFIFTLAVSTNPDENFGFAKNSITYIVSENTDWRSAVMTSLNYVKSVFKSRDNGTEFEPITDMCLPMNEEIVSDFGTRIKEGGDEEFHYGVDFLSKNDDKILCCADGSVEEIGRSEEFGNFILIQHNARVSSYYAGCGEILPQMGDWIKKGQVIATAGTSAEMNDPHLHFEIREGEESLDPKAFLNIEEIKG